MEYIERKEVIKKLLALTKFGAKMDGEQNG